MKLRIIVLALLCIGFACNAQNKIDKQGRRQGHWIKTDKDGSKIFEGDFKDGKEVGTFNYYYPNGNLRIRNVFTEPGRYCSHEAYDEQGHLLARGFYNQKNRDGIWHYYNEKGLEVKTASYKMGVKHGTHIIFTSNGDTAEVSTWNDNHRHGRWWKRIGEKGWITASYTNGILSGKLVEYDDNGKLVQQGTYNKEGRKDGSYRYYEGGNMTIDETWDNGLLRSRKILFHTPQPNWVAHTSLAYFMPKGNGTRVYLNDGKVLSASESLESILNRVGEEQFVIIDKKNRVYASRTSIAGLKVDAEGRQVLDLVPTPAFTIYPDEECIKMVKSLQRVDELDQ